jgi:hypothetical protein
VGKEYLGDDRLEEFGDHGAYVGTVGGVGISHDGRGVGVDEDDLVSGGTARVARKHGKDAPR